MQKEATGLPDLLLAGGDTLPAIGLGTWKSRRHEAVTAVTTALAAGYRHFDCASIYKNEAEIGETLQRAGATTKRRRELFITSKLWNNAHLPRHVRPALEQTLRQLRLDYIDLYLIHWPVSFSADCEHPKRPQQFLPPDEERILSTWRALEKLVHKGLIRNLGVSNFKLSRLQRLCREATIRPVVNQVECHPFLPQHQLVRWCQNNGVVVTAFSPLGSADRPMALRRQQLPELLSQPLLLEIAAETGRSPAAVALAWNLARGVAVIPKSVTPRHISDNIAATTLTLNDDQLARLKTLDCGRRLIDGAPFCKNSEYTKEWLWGEEPA